MYIEVVLPVPIADTFTYFVPPEMEAQIVSGSMVLVNFGKNKCYSGLVSHIRQIPPENTQKIKPILGIENSEPVIRRPQLRFWEWISNYYLCSLGEVYKAVMPAGLRSEKTQYNEKKETFVRFVPEYIDPGKLEEAFQKVKRSAKQEQLLLTFIQATKSQHSQSISKRELLKISQVSDLVLQGVIKKKILETYEESVSRLATYEKDTFPLNILNPLQEQAYTEIIQSFRKKDVSLLHGVTSSGKTEIYTHLIEETIRLNRQVLYLVPEIALTQDLTDRLKKFFGDKLGVYHSGVNNNERVEIWNNLLTDSGYHIILGVRSSVFLPFRDLGLIIVDEEHETSFKQQDPAPRYHARNAAIVLATMHGSKVVLGSATPSVETFYNAEKGKYGYIKIEKRFESTELPAITPVNVKELRRKKKMKSIFSPLMIEKMAVALEKGEQVLIFQNRRGFAPVVQCRICDWTPKCRFCDISLNYHKKFNRLSCHYCGKTYRIPTECPECGSTDLQTKGYGTEKIEEEIRTIFPAVPAERMDTDTTRKKNSFHSILSRFASGETKILIGTQMISKGLDFGNVSLVCIVNADSLMNFPDFRAYERAYQLMSQVAGRAGRRKNQGEVILQTSHPEHPLIQMVLQHNYEGMYEMQMEERAMFHYPPFFRIIEITLKYKNEELVTEAAIRFASLLRNELGDRVMGPDKPVIGKIQNLYIRRIMLKMEVSASISAIREILSRIKKDFSEVQKYKYITILYDVDPM